MSSASVVVFLLSRLLKGRGRYLLLTLYLIYFTWFITLFTIGIKKANQFNLFKSIILAIAGLAVYQTMLFIFIR